jgi:hypothetical protein
MATFKVILKKTNKKGEAPVYLTFIILKGKRLKYRYDSAYPPKNLTRRKVMSNNPMNFTLTKIFLSLILRLKSITYLSNTGYGTGQDIDSRSVLV